MAGDFSFGCGSLYFWQALLQTQHLRSAFINRLIFSNAFKTIMFSRILYKINGIRMNKQNIRLPMFKEIVRYNRCNYRIIFILYRIGILFEILRYGYRVISKIFKIITKFSIRKVRYNLYWTESSQINMLKASNAIETLLSKRGLMSSVE